MGLELERGSRAIFFQKIWSKLSLILSCFWCHSFTSEAQRTFVTLHFACSVRLSPQNSAPAISLSQKWWPRVLEIPKKFHAVNEKAERAPQGIQFFSFWGGVGWDYFFPLVPNAFLMCSHHFRMGSLSGFQRVLQIPRLLPKTFPIAPRICPYGLPKSNSHVYKLKRWAIWGPHLFLVCNCGQKRCFFLGSAQCSKRNWWWAIKMALLQDTQNKKKINDVRPTLN